MTDKTTEALKLAEEALNSFDPYDSFECLWKQTQDIDVDKALAAIRTCLEQVSEVSQETEAEALAEQSLGEYHGKLMREVCNKVITKTLAEPVKQEPVATVNANDEGYWADILPDRDVKVGQLLYAAPVSAKMQGDCTLAAVLAEREACAKACEEGTALTAFQSKDCYSYAYNRAWVIRARGEK